MYGFQRIALCVPECKVADVDYNCDKILALAKQAAKEKAGVVVFPELSVTTASCGDLFHSQALLTAAENGVARLLKKTSQRACVRVRNADDLAGTAV